MSIRNLPLVALALSAFTSLATHAATAEGLVGASFGYTPISENGGGSGHFIAAPASVIGFQPGLRLGGMTADRRWSVFGDFGLLMETAGGGSATIAMVEPQVQFNALPHAAVTPTFNVGGGFFHADGDGGSGTTQALIGAGLGIQHDISDRHGHFRAELRLEHVMEKKSGPFVEQSAFTLVSVKLGFDLLVAPPGTGHHP